MVKLTLVLASGPGTPAGDLNDRMYLNAELTAQGQLDAAAWETGTTPWLSARDRPGRPKREGELVKIHEGWALRGLDGEDDPLYTLTAGVIRPGELVTISRLDGDEMIYRIVAVDSV